MYYNMSVVHSIPDTVLGISIHDNSCPPVKHTQVLPRNPFYFQHNIGVKTRPDIPLADYPFQDNVINPFADHTSNFVVEVPVMHQADVYFAK